MDLFERKKIAETDAVKIKKKKKIASIAVTDEGEYLEVSNPDRYVTKHTVFYVKHIDGEYITSVDN